MSPTGELPVTALDGEQLLLQSPTRYLLTTPSGWGYNPINGELTLTSHRLIVKPDVAVTRTQRIVLGAAGASVVWFPLRRVVACSEQPMKVQWGRPNVLKVEFDNGGREYFVVHAGKTMPPGTWAAALMKAQADAPDLAYDRLPATKPGFEQSASFGARRMMIYWLIGIVVLCLVCSVVAVLVNSFGQ